jgi:uncharacterized protein (TIGR02598 family)
MKQRSWSAFSLIELTLALGIAAVCLLAVMGLIPIAVQTNRNATSQTAATNIVASVIADMRATTSSTSPQYRITFGTAKTLYFDAVGACSVNVNGSTKVDGSAWNPPLQTRYQLNVTFSQQNPTPTPPALPTIYTDFKVTWPAAATAANALGSAEMFAAFDRN